MHPNCHSYFGPLFNPTAPRGKVRIFISRGNQFNSSVSRSQFDSEVTGKSIKKDLRYHPGFQFDGSIKLAARGL